VQSDQSIAVEINYEVSDLDPESGLVIGETDDGPILADDADTQTRQGLRRGDVHYRHGGYRQVIGMA